MIQLGKAPIHPNKLNQEDHNFEVKKLQKVTCGSYYINITHKRNCGMTQWDKLEDYVCKLKTEKYEMMDVLNNDANWQVMS